MMIYSQAYVKKLICVLFLSIVIGVVQTCGSAASGRRDSSNWHPSELFEVSSTKEVICPNGTTGVMMSFKVTSKLLPQRYHSARCCPIENNDDNGPRRWDFTSYDKAGRKVDEGEYLDGEMHGKWTSWHPNGHKQGESYYENGKKVGSFITWHENGSIAVTGSYSDGQPHGIWLYRDPDGRLIKRIHWQTGRCASIEKFD